MDNDFKDKKPASEKREWSKPSVKRRASIDRVQGGTRLDTYENINYNPS